MNQNKTLVCLGKVSGFDKCAVGEIVKHKGEWALVEYQDEDVIVRMKVKYDLLQILPEPAYKIGAKVHSEMSRDFVNVRDNKPNWLGWEASYNPRRVWTVVGHSWTGRGWHYIIQHAKGSGQQSEDMLRPMDQYELEVEWA